MYEATITATITPSLVQKCFAQEEKDIQGRAEYTIASKGDTVTFAITAKDSTALRTAMNGITKILTVIEKTKDIE